MPNSWVIIIEVSHKNCQQQIVFTITQGLSPLGYVVIDTMVNGSATGGLRIVSEPNVVEMQDLARTMTLKFGFLGLPQGGAKAAVIGDPEVSVQKYRQKLVTFGKAIEPFLRRRIFCPAADMGTTTADIRYMLHSAGVKIQKRELPGGKSGYYTALSVFTGARQVAKHSGLNLSRCRVAIQGFGKVGSALAQLFDDADASVVAISTSSGAIYNPNGLKIKKLIPLAAKYGSRVVNCYRDAVRISKDALLELPVDVLCPCANTHSVNEQNASRIRSRVICAGANLPLTSEAEQILFDRGIICLPCFVTNSGGVLGSTMAFTSLNENEIGHFIERQIGSRIGYLLRESSRLGKTSSKIAIPLSLQRHHQVSEKAADPALQNRAFSFLLALYRRGYIPGFLVAPFSLSYFDKSLAW